jgi:4-amino-4-deoxy-L-arabinose transferase-like glycosyltransferase
VRLRPDGKFFLRGAIIVLLAFVLRVYQIGEHEIWFDEVISFHIAVTPHWLTSMKLSHHPPFYYFLLRGWVFLAGTSESFLRLPSAIFGTAFVIVLIWAGQTIFDRAVGLWSGAFAVVAPMHVYYSQEARSYALLLMLLVLTYGVLWRALQKNNARSWLLFFVVQLATLYTHYFAVIALAPSILLLAVWPEPEGLKKRWSGYLSASFASGLFLLVYAGWHEIWGAEMTSRGNWISVIWQDLPPGLAIPKSLEVLTLGVHSGSVPIYLKQMGSIQIPVFLRYSGILILLLLAVLVMVPWGERPCGIPWLGKRKLWVGTLAVFPLGVLWIVSLFFKPVYVVGRYDMIAFPAIALLVGLALRKLQGLKTIGLPCALALFFGVALVNGAKVYAYYQADSPPWGKETAEFLDKYARKSDVIIFTKKSVRSLYYLYRLGYTDGHCHNATAGRMLTCRIVSPDLELQLLNLRRPEPKLTTDSVSGIQRAVLDYLTSRGSLDGRVWLVGGWDGNSMLMTRQDVQLVEELGRLGFAQKHIRNVPWVMVLRRATSE